MKRFLVLAVAIFLPMLLTTAAQSQDSGSRAGKTGDLQQPGTQPAQRSFATDLRGTENAPVVIPTPKPDEEIAQEKADRQDKSSADWWMVRLTGAIAMIGIAQAVVFWIQATRLRQTIDKMDEIAVKQGTDMKISIGEAARAAGAMERVAESIASNVETTRNIATTQREFWERQMRAYVLPENCSLWDGTAIDPPQPERMNVPGVVMSVKNSGLTPAYGVISWAQIEIVDVKNENLLTVPPLQSNVRSTVAPHGSFSKALWFHRALTPHEISDVQTGIRAIYVYGRIEYQDAMKQSRYSDFRLRYMGHWPPGKGHVLNFSEGGNEAN